MFTMPHKNTPLVAVVGCSAIKTKGSAPASEFYRSPLFKAAMAYARARAEHVVIVSARYEAVRLEQVLEPYDLKLSTLSKSEREAWGARTVDTLRTWFKPAPLLLLLCGEKYADAILYGAHWHHLPRPLTPMAKMAGVGARIAFLQHETALALQKRNGERQP